MEKESSKNPIVVIASIAFLAIAGFLIAEGLTQTYLALKLLLVITGIIVAATAVSLMFVQTETFLRFARSVSKRLPTNDRIMQSIEGHIIDSEYMCYVGAAIFGAAAMFNTYYFQYFMFGFGGHPSDIKQIISMIIAGAFLVAPSVVSKREILIMPQGVLVYRVTSSNVNKDQLEARMKEILNASPSVEPKDYEKILDFNVIRFDRTSKEQKDSRDSPIGAIRRDY